VQTASDHFDDPSLLQNLQQNHVSAPHFSLILGLSFIVNIVCSVINFNESVGIFLSHRFHHPVHSFFYFSCFFVLVCFLSFVLLH